MKSLDFSCEFVKETPLPIKTLGAIKFSNQAQFNPRKYALVLCDIIIQKCELSFNNIKKTGDCPCHGSRYDINGNVLLEPAIHGIEKIEIE